MREQYIPGTNMYNDDIGHSSSRAYQSNKVLSWDKARMGVGDGEAD